MGARVNRASIALAETTKRFDTSEIPPQLRFHSFDSASEYSHREKQHPPEIGSRPLVQSLGTYRSSRVESSRLGCGLGAVGNARRERLAVKHDAIRSADETPDSWRAVLGYHHGNNDFIPGFE